MDLQSLFNTLENIKDLPAIKNQLSELLEKVNKIIDATPVKEFYTIDDISTELGYSKYMIRQSPWLMPNWGVPDFCKRPKKWYAKTYKNWFAIPVQERKKQWNAMSTAEKQQSLGISPFNKQAI